MVSECHAGKNSSCAGQRRGVTMATDATGRPAGLQSEWAGTSPLFYSKNLKKKREWNEENIW